MIGGSRAAAGALTGLVALLLVAVPVLAAEGQVDLRSELPVSIEGSRLATADGAFLIEGDGGTLGFLLHGQEGMLERIVHRAYGYVRPDEPRAGIQWDQRVEVERIPVQDTYLFLEHRLPTFTLLAYDATVASQEGAAGGPLHIGALGTSRTVKSDIAPPISIGVGSHESKPFAFHLPAGQFLMQALDGRTLIEGDFRLYIADARLDYRGVQGSDTLLAHFREEIHPGGVYDPVNGRWIGPGTHTEYVHEYLRLDLKDARLQVQHRDLPAYTFTRAPSVDVSGLAHFPAATGTVTIAQELGDKVHGLHGDELTLGGRFTIALDRLDRASGTTAVHGSGDFTQVSYAAQTHQYDWARIAAVTGISAMLAGLVAWFAGAGKSLLGGGLITGYARVHGEEILEHPGRLATYECIKQEPGLHFMDLEKRLPFGPSTLTYHIRVLERNEYVTRVKDGRYVRFFDRRNGEYSRDRKLAASALRNDTTAAIAAHIRENPGVVQRDLAHHFGIAASTVSWHVARLQENGLVEKQRDQHFTRYYLGRAWSSLPAGELQRVGLVA